MDELLHSFQTLQTIDGVEEFDIIMRAMREMPETLEGRIKYIHDAFIRYSRYVKYVDFDLYPWINNPVKEFIANYPHLSKMPTNTIIDFYKLAKTIDHMIIVRFEDETIGAIDEEI
jgi:hypothetical protein